MNNIFKLSIATASIISSLVAQDNLPGEIKVVATKLTDTQLESSSSVAVIDNDKINDYQIKNIEDISSIVSNTNISGIGNRSDRTFSFRGISNYTSYESSVAMFVDNVPIPMSYGYGAIDMNNINFIEILKGPQSTLFGKNAESGVINIFTKEPTKKLKREINIDIAEYNSKNIFAHISGPTANKKLLYSFSITSNTSDGYTKNTQTNSNFDRRDLKSFSSKLKYIINDNSDLKLNYTKSDIDDGGSPFKLNTKNDPYNVGNEPINDSIKMKNDLLSLVYTKKENAYKFTSTTTYAKQDFKKKDYVGILGGLLMNFDVDIEEITQEFRLNYLSDNYDLLGGLFYSDKFKFDYKEHQTLQALSLNSINNLSNTDDNQAIYLQGRYWLNNSYALSLGGRYQRVNRDFNRDLTKFDTTNTKGKDTTTWNYFSPMASLNYFNNSGDNIYFTYTQGFRPGGYNYRQESSTLTPYKEETTNSYELGYKKSKRNYNINTTLFYNDINDLRINTFDDNLATTTYNANKAYSYGFEGELSYKSTNFDIFSTVGLIKAKIKSFVTNPNLESKKLIDIPQKTASLGGKYKIYKNYYLSGNISHMGKRYYNKENTKYLDSYTIANISTGYQTKNMDLSLYVNNLQDKVYNDFMIATPSNSYYHFGKPRVIGIKFNKKF